MQLEILRISLRFLHVFIVYKHTNSQAYIRLLCAALTVLFPTFLLPLPDSVPALFFQPQLSSSSSSFLLSVGQGSSTVLSVRHEEFDLKKGESRQHVLLCFVNLYVHI